MRSSKAFLAASLLIFLSTSQRTFAQGDEGTIVGEIRVQRGGFPPHRVEVTLEARGGLVGSTYSDDEGKFSFYALKANLYHVLIHDNQKKEEP